MIISRTTALSDKVRGLLDGTIFAVVAPSIPTAARSRPWCEPYTFDPPEAVRVVRRLTPGKVISR